MTMLRCNCRINVGWDEMFLRKHTRICGMHSEKCVARNEKLLRRVMYESTLFWCNERLFFRTLRSQYVTHLSRKKHEFFIFVGIKLRQFLQFYGNEMIWKNEYIISQNASRYLRHFIELSREFLSSRRNSFPRARLTKMEGALYVPRGRGWSGPAPRRHRCLRYTTPLLSFEGQTSHVSRDKAVAAENNAGRQDYWGRPIPR